MMKMSHTPTQFLSMLKVICSLEDPFIMDIDNDLAVWNYPYDKVTVSKHDNCEIPHKKTTVGNTTYYNFKLYSNAYPQQNLDLWGFVNKTKRDINDKNIITPEYQILEKWITQQTPDFLWKKFKVDGGWKGNSLINPFINSTIVHKIYKHSFNKENITLKL